MGDATTSLVEAIWPVKSTEVVYCSNAIMDRYVEACLRLGPVAKGRQCVDGDRMDESSVPVKIESNTH
jgi:hypothetical protein